MNSAGHRYFIVNKPYDMVSQFVSSHEVRLLGDLEFGFPLGIHAVGRLDNHSEGLLILTTDKRMTRLLFESEIPHCRSYLVMVKNIVSDETVAQLRNGVDIRVKTGVYYRTTPCKVEIVDKPEGLFAHPDPFIEKGPHTWLLISLTEGKFHQVRKMVSAVHHRCKRLIRVSIEGLHLHDLKPGEVKEIPQEELFSKLKISSPAVP